jgi:hypothetical protein
VDRGYEGYEGEVEGDYYYYDDEYEYDHEDSYGEEGEEVMEDDVDDE